MLLRLFSLFAAIATPDSECTISKGNAFVQVDHAGTTLAIDPGEGRLAAVSNGLHVGGKLTLCGTGDVKTALDRCSADYNNLNNLVLKIKSEKDTLETDLTGKLSALAEKYTTLLQLVQDQQTAISLLQNPPTTTVTTATTTTVTTSTVTTTKTTTPYPKGPPAAVGGIRWYSDMETFTNKKLKDLTEYDGGANNAAFRGNPNNVQYLADAGVAGSGCLRFLEKHAFYKIPANAQTLIDGARPRTISLYMKIESSRKAEINDGDYAFGMGTDCPSSTASTGTSFNMRFGPNRHLGFMGCADDEHGKYGNPFSVDDWHHVMYTYDGSTLRIIVNGKLSVKWTKNLHTSSWTEKSKPPVVLIGSHTGAGSREEDSDITGADILIDEFYIIDHKVDKDSDEYENLRCHPFKAMGKKCPPPKAYVA